MQRRPVGHQHQGAKILMEKTDIPRNDHHAGNGRQCQLEIAETFLNLHHERSYLQVLGKGCFRDLGWKYILCGLRQRKSRRSVNLRSILHRLTRRKEYGERQWNLAAAGSDAGRKLVGGKVGLVESDSPLLQFLQSELAGGHIGNKRVRDRLDGDCLGRRPEQSYAIAVDQTDIGQGVATKHRQGWNSKRRPRSGYQGNRGLKSRTGQFGAYGIVCGQLVDNIGATEATGIKVSRYLGGDALGHCLVFRRRFQPHANKRELKAGKDLIEAGSRVGIRKD